MIKEVVLDGGAVGLVLPPIRRGTLSEMRQDVERFLIEDALRRNGGSKTEAARDLGMTREGLHKRIKQIAEGWNR